MNRNRQDGGQAGIMQTVVHQYRWCHWFDCRRCQFQQHVLVECWI